MLYLGRTLGTFSDTPPPLPGAPHQKRTILNNQLLDPAITRHDIDFSALPPEHFKEAFETLIPRLKEQHEYSVTEAPLTFEALLVTDEVSRQLSCVSGLLGHLTSVAETPELRDIYAEYMPVLSTVYQELGLDERVPARLKQYLDTDEARSLDPMRLSIVNDVIRSFEREGVYLDVASKTRLAELSARNTELTQQFENNLTDFASAVMLTFSADELKGVPARTLENATQLDDGRYEITLLSGGFSDIASYCEVESTRKAVYEYQFKEGVEAPLDNRALLVDIVNIAQERAKLLGFPNYATYALDHTMANTPENALAFEEDLAARSHAQAIRESQEVTTYGTQLLGRKPQFHDRAFVVEKLQQSRYAFDSEKVRQYFPVRTVVAGLFSLLEQLYDISFVANHERSTWHADVEVYDMVDRSNGRNLGFIYVDLFKRKNKKGGAWMNAAQTRHEENGQTYLPVTYLVCNAPKDKGQEPTLDFGEVVTLFHEMGHTLHNQLTEINEEFFSGLHQVPHDAIELPSQFLENFCWDYETVKLISRHVDTGEPLPEAEFEKLKASRSFMGATSILAAARYSLMDLLIYMNPGIDPFKVEAEVLQTWNNRERDARMPILATFTHIFSGGYNAGYYAYQWAEMLSADAFSALKEEGASFHEQKNAAMRFRKHILAAGGYGNMAENFRAFRSRDPDIQHLLHNYGVA